MFYIDATVLKPVFEAEATGSLLPASQYTYDAAEDKIAGRKDIIKDPRLNAFATFCLEVAFPIVTAANPQRFENPIVYFETRPGSGNDYWHKDYPGVENDQLNTFFTMSSLPDGRTASTYFPRSDVPVHRRLISPLIVPREEQDKAFNIAPQYHISVFDPDREMHGVSPDERKTLFRARVINHNPRKESYSWNQRRLKHRKILSLRRTDERVKLPEAA